MFKFIQVSSLEKVFLDHNNFKNEFNEMSVLKSERFFYQIAYTYIDEGETTSRRISDFAIKITSPLKNYISMRTVENVPAQLTHYPNSCDNDYLRKKPGLYPDLLMPLKQNIISVCQNIWHSLWITVDAPESVSAGKYPIE